MASDAKVGEGIERGRAWGPCIDEKKKVHLGQRIIMLGIYVVYKVGQVPWG